MVFKLSDKQKCCFFTSWLYAASQELLIHVVDSPNFILFWKLIVVMNLVLFAATYILYSVLNSLNVFMSNALECILLQLYSTTSVLHLFSLHTHTHVQHTL